ncbi:helix-turn-helix transcriptional regulator [Rhodoferax sp. GW822-FHT02A01]|uniref:helix-turn-helix domain-containing protein n=1 Tax=Rhodoferax sp. GW822-FHT02A01 TaxID=3141537 RepID=UPI00315C9E1F
MTLYSHRYALLRDELIRLRTEAGLTQRMLCDKIKKSQSFVSKVENGERYLDIIDFIDWTKAIKADPAVLIQRIASVKG